ncbi:UDP-N-acetyl-D-mannosamine dehydrogenase [Mannheimia varigena]|uniref:UDP-N-acetyl-D-mannosamine dehydrogenase n=1 Tax=Mannheimia varigena TaxID=85404 RepID=UPI000DBF34A1|nr:UDP-N-acetyl-D-mannosamine dehydrogenase [Mannheimia varigena]AWW33578.1 UDP-N-acetyl-D-mannosamine dehydrogenase [Mannheimia varigena]
MQTTKFNRICIVGLGYIGLPTAAVFANVGRKVIGVDINPLTVSTINQGKIHIVEPKLEEAVLQAVKNGCFFATDKPQPADAFIIAVPTPLNARQPDLSYIRNAALVIAPHLRQGNLVVLESTSPVGTTEQLAQWLSEARPDLQFPIDVQIAYCPERVLPGKIMTEIIENDRIIGGLSEKCSQQAVDLYQLFAKGECVKTSARTAEMCKLVENSFRDVNIAFANELSMLCDELNINVWELIELANRHPRVNILEPGAGVGGHCIAVDPWFIVEKSPKLARLIRTAREVNDSKPNWVFEKIKAMVADGAAAKDCKPSELTIACLGLAFKPDIDDLRESPALQITQKVAEWHKGKVLAVEPNIQHLELENAELVELDFALKQADILVLLVDHSPFKQISAEQISQRFMVDCRGVWRK